VTAEPRPAFYALSPGGWRDYVTLLHPPYTLWHLSYVAIGAGLAPHLEARRLLVALAAFFLAVGIGAHALDELKGLPPALVIVDENDILRDEGEAYASKLRDADVPTACVRFDGTMHDFMMLAALRDTETTHAAIDLAASTFRRAFGTAANARGGRQ